MLDEGLHEDDVVGEIFADRGEASGGVVVGTGGGGSSDPAGVGGEGG